MTDPRRTSASRLPLLAHCAYSARPDVVVPPEAPREDAALGVIKHCIYEALALGETPDPDDCIAAELDRDHLAAVRGWLHENVPTDTRIVERAFAWNPKTDTGRMLPKSEHRDYSEATADELVGTVDLAWVVDGIVHVGDWKSGWGAHVEAAARNRQLRALALYVARAAEQNHIVQGAVVHVLKVGSDGHVHDTQAPFDSFDLAEIADEITTLRARIPTALPVVGEHCRGLWCPLAGACPAHVEALATVVEVLPEPTGELAPVPLTKEAAARLVKLAPQVKSWLEAAERGIRAFVDEHGMIDVDGRFWGAKLTPREGVSSTPAALEVLRAHGLEAAIETTSSTSKAAIHKAALAVTARGKGAEKEREVMTALGAVGALQVAPIKQYGFQKESKE